MKRWLILTGVVGLLAGCGSPCIKLASKICDCQASQTDRDNCNANVSARASQVTITSDDEATCEKFIDTCACHELNTPQGKRNCGLAR